MRETGTLKTQNRILFYFSFTVVCSLPPDEKLSLSPSKAEWQCIFILFYFWKIPNASFVQATYTITLFLGCWWIFGPYPRRPSFSEWALESTRCGKVNGGGIGNPSLKLMGTLHTENDRRFWRSAPFFSPKVYCPIIQSVVWRFFFFLAKLCCVRTWSRLWHFASASTNVLLMLIIVLLRCYYCVHYVLVRRSVHTATPNPTHDGL